MEAILAIDAELLLRAYANGIFPMADSRDDPDTFWVEPQRRAILPFDRFHVSRSLAKTVRQDRFTVTSDRDFAQVISTCAQQAENREETWINAEIEEAFIQLHRAGHTHSVECWQDGELVGGLYGLALGRAFFGESMFSRQTNASKVALVWLMARLRIGGFQLLDCQFLTDHLASLGVVEIEQEEYLQLLSATLGGEDSGEDQVSAPSAELSPPPASGDWGVLDGFLASGSARGASSPGKLILQALTHTS